MLDAPTLLNIIRQKGPSIPRDIMKEQGGDTFLIGAILSTLCNAGQLRFTNVKVGGTPVYYLPGQEGRLVDFMKHLHEQEKKACELLRQKGILKDTELEPVTRVALRNSKDFAKAVEVEITGSKVIFWRWFLLSEENTREQIRATLYGSEKHTEDTAEPSKAEDTEKPKQEMPKTETIPEKKEAKTEPKADQKTETRPDVKAEPKIEPKPDDMQEERHPVKKDEAKPESQTTIAEASRPKKETKKKKEEPAGGFLDKVKRHFEKNNIEILQTEMSKKSEMDFIISVPSAAGRLSFYCKARSKKKVSEGDLSTAYVMGEQKKLPVLFITDGELTKKSEEMTRSLRNMTVTRI